MWVKVSSASTAAVGHVMWFLHKFQIYEEYEMKRFGFSSVITFPLKAIALGHIDVQNYSFRNVPFSIQFLFASLFSSVVVTFENIFLFELSSFHLFKANKYHGRDFFNFLHTTLHTFVSVEPVRLISGLDTLMAPRGTVIWFINWSRRWRFVGPSW